jgi:putative redox protein
MREASSRTAEGKFRQTVTIGPHVLTSDEPRADGGEDLGPTPQELLAAALASCTSMTMKMYADLKGWPLEAAEVKVTIEQSGGVRHFLCTIAVQGPLDDAQRQRLLEIGKKCPIHKILIGKVEIDAKLV